MNMNTAEQCRFLAAKARVKALAVSDESDAYLAIARQYEAIAAVMESGQDNASDDRAADGAPSAAVLQSISAPSSKNG